MQTTPNPESPRRDTRISTLLEIAAKAPTLLLRAVLSIRMQLQSHHPSLCPLVIDIGEADSWGRMESPWLAKDECTHGFLVPDDRELKVVFPDLNGKAMIFPTSSLGRLAAVHPATMSVESWLAIDFESVVPRGQAVITIYDDGSAPSEWVEVVDEFAASFRIAGLQGFESTPLGFNDIIAPTAFAEALKGLPDQFTEAMHDLSSEIDHLVGHIAPLGDLEFEQIDQISIACIGALVPGIRALAFHGFGWPILSPEDAKGFLCKLRHAQPVSLASLASFDSELNPQRCEQLLSFLLNAGIIKVEDDLVSLVGVADFLASQVRYLTGTKDGDPSKHNV